MDEPTLYAFLDYRAWLRAWFAARAGRPSQRRFAADVGCSPPLLTAILKAERDLDAHLAERFADRLALDDRQRHYFTTLVEYNQAPTLARRRGALDVLLGEQAAMGARQIEGDLYEVFGHWYVLAIAELARCDAWVDDPAWIATTLMPPITEAQARSAMDVLVRLGILVERDRTLARSEDDLATHHQAPPQLVSLALASLYDWMLERAAAVLREVPARERHFGTLTFAASPAQVTEMRERVRDLERHAMGLAAGQTGGRTRVYTLGVQLFPLSHSTD